MIVDARLKPIKIGRKEIYYKLAAYSRLYWADRPTMRVVQALYWMQDMLAENGERQRVQSVLRRLFADSQHGQMIRDGPRAGLSALPVYMQEFLRRLPGPFFMRTSATPSGKPIQLKMGGALRVE